MMSSFTIEKSPKREEINKGNNFENQYDQLARNPLGDSKVHKVVQEYIIKKGHGKLQTMEFSMEANLKERDAYVIRGTFGRNIDKIVAQGQASLVLADYKIENQGSYKGVNGILCESTIKALQEFQETVGLEKTKGFDQDTMKTLDLATASGLKRVELLEIGNKARDLAEKEQQLKKVGRVEEINNTEISNFQTMELRPSEDLDINSNLQQLSASTGVINEFLELAQPVHNLPVKEIEKKIEGLYGQAALDVVKEVIGKQDLKEYMNQHNIKNLNQLQIHIVKMYRNNEDARRIMIANLGVRYYESTKTKEYPLGNGLDTMAYTADAVWFLAGGDKKQFANDFAYAFNKDVNGKLFGGESANNRQWNINQIVINNAPKGWAENFGGLPSTGFKPELKDGLVTAYDQTHHFSAVLLWASKYGEINGVLAAYWVEVDNGMRNQNDIRLGNLAVAAYKDPEFWRSPSKWIKTYLGE